ncbi:4Fe-4S binding protein [Clostridium sp. OS1-26]|nr:4Fe-4S binding protein [Clostridium sp. OS1-26]WML34522.1 4Fe-4S binding protein [Clostridium sp. OS1-26]
MNSVSPIKTVKEKCTGCNKCIRACPILGANICSWGKTKKIE